MLDAMLLHEGQKLLLEGAAPMVLLLTLDVADEWSQELMYDMGLIQPSLRGGRNTKLLSRR